ncbi:iron-containing alcohol dehydrogenase [Aquibium sp. LZ166]|uniref:Iron-containing alcohol dehydrogenase n=1 Tax=Aquibium pacificus TaxID=3153579 RepID=A0ABV3SPJ9_9HYPH
MNIAKAAASIDAVKALQVELGVPTRLREVGLSKELFPAIARHVMGDRSLYFNPSRTDTVEPVLAILEEAW